MYSVKKFCPCSVNVCDRIFSLVGVKLWFKKITLQNFNDKSVIFLGHLLKVRYFMAGFKYDLLDIPESLSCRLILRDP